MPKLPNGTWAEIIRVGAAVAAVVLTLWIYNETQADGIQRQLGEIDKRLAVIENNRFTSGNGLQLAQQFFSEMTMLREEMARLPSEVPPKWFLERVDRIETRLDAIDGRLRAMERRSSGE